MTKRIVVWGTGFVGRMVITEVFKHPLFELVGVGVSDPDKVGRDAGEICGIADIGVAATSDVEELIALKPDALVHYGPTAARAKDNIRLISAFLRAGIDVVSTAMTPWVWPAMPQNPSHWIEPITDACADGGASCFTTGIDPGFANDLLPLTLMGLCAEVRKVRALELLDYINYTGDYEVEMGIGRPPSDQALLEHPDILMMSWGATVPMIAHAAGIELDEITTTWDKWVTDVPIETAKGVIDAGNVAAIRFTIDGVYKGETRIQLEHVNRIGNDAAPEWPRGTQNDVYRVEIEGSPSITQETAFRFTDGSGRDAAAAGCLATGLRALNAVPAVNELPAGWVTALDLPLIGGAGTIRWERSHMDWSFTDEQEEVAALARQILERELPEERMREIERTDDRFDARLFAQLGEAGVLGVALPDAHGGGGLGLIEQCRVLQEVGRTVAPVPALATMVAGAAIAAFGSRELQDAYLPDAARGTKVLTVALAEDLNLDPSSPTTQAVAANGGWTLSGQKTTVGSGTIADVFLVPASTRDGAAVFVVERGDAGVSVERQRVTSTDADAIVSFDGVALDAGRRLAGAEAIEWLVRHFTVALCAVQLGVCERALELTAEYAKTRVQFERPIATFQAVGQRLADAYIDVNAIRLTTWQAAWRLSEGLDCSSEIATAKFWAADAGHRVAHTAVHVHGGMGIDLDYHLNRYFVAAKRIEFALGGATEQLVALGRELASEPA